MGGRFLRRRLHPYSLAFPNKSEVNLAPLLALDRPLDAPAATGNLALRAYLRAR